MKINGLCFVVAHLLNIITIVLNKKKYIQFGNIVKLLFHNSHYYFSTSRNREWVFSSFYWLQENTVLIGYFIRNYWSLLSYAWKIECGELRSLVYVKLKINWKLKNGMTWCTRFHVMIAICATSGKLRSKSFPELRNTRWM